MKMDTTFRVSLPCLPSVLCFHEIIGAGIMIKIHNCDCLFGFEVKQSIPVGYACFSTMQSDWIISMEVTLQNMSYPELRYNSQAAGGSNIGQGHSGAYQKCLCILLLPTSGAISQMAYESQIC